MSKDNIWILTEERPKNQVVFKILELYAKDFNDSLSVFSCLDMCAFLLQKQ